jgi:hypothetical protein
MPIGQGALGSKSPSTAGLKTYRRSQTATLGGRSVVKNASLPALSISQNGRLESPAWSASSDFVSQTLFQLQTAARLPCGGISEIAVNAALSMIESARPKDEVEAALIIQMACTHTAAMAVLSRIAGAHGGDRHVAMMAAAASKMLRAFAIQVETLRRLRAGGSQYMRIEHIHIEPEAQAVIGNLQSRGGERE